MLLYDLIQQHDKQVAANIHAIIGQAPKYDVSNIAKYFLEHKKEHWTLNDLKYANPPFNKMWLEYRWPYTMTKDGMIITTPPPNTHMYYGGCLIGGKEGTGVTGTYLLLGQFWKWYNHTLECVFANALRFEVVNNMICNIKSFDPLTGVIRTDENGFVYYSAYPMLLAFSFANTKNVETITVSPSHKLNRARCKRGKVPHVSYKVINVLPFGKIHSQQQRQVRETDMLPLHIRAGHFARYGPMYGKGLLFGKHEGMYWIPQTLVGDSKYGVAVHDYSMEEVS